MTYNTEDCKNYLVKQYPHTDKKDWKRTRKYKDSLGNECRDFVNKKHNLQISLKATYYGLYEFLLLQELHNKLPKVYEKVSIHERLFGGGVTQIQQSSNNEAKFLHVLENGIDWNEKEGQRSSYDFAKNIDFNAFIKLTPNLLEHYLEYMYGAVAFALDLDETYMLGQITAQGYDDTFVDLLEVLKKIISSYKFNDLPLTGHKSIIIKINSTMNDVKTMADCEDENQYLECDSVIQDIKQNLQVLV